MFNYFLMICFLTFPSYLLTFETICSNEAKTLTTFFDSTLLDSTIGYVLLNQKPCCTLEYNKTPISRHDLKEEDRFNNSLYLAKKYLSQPKYNSKNILFLWDNEYDTLIVVNKKLFLEVVRDNLALFQYGLSPAITPEALLESLTKIQSLQKTLNYDRVLIGITLGFGVQNSLYASRKENLTSDHVVIKDLPPKVIPAKYIVDDYDKSYLQETVTSYFHNFRKSTLLTACPGFETLNDELEYLKSKDAKEDIRVEKPYFIFGYNKEDPYTQELLKKINATKIDIQNLHRSEKCLEQILGIICNDDVFIEKPAHFAFEVRNEQVNTILAKYLQNQISPFPTQYHKYFTDAVLGNIKNEIKPNYSLLFTPTIYKIRDQALNNLKEADQFFSLLQNDKSYSKIVKDQLYYKVLIPGYGPSLYNEITLVVDYEITDPQGNILNKDKTINIDLRDTIPGFFLGVSGMKIGEKREIHIHPSLAYGLSTLLDKNIRLKAIVTLHDIIPVTGKLPSIVKDDTQFIDELFDEDKDLKDSLSYLGIHNRQKLQQYPEIHIDQVIKEMEKLNGPQVISNDEIETLNEFIWNQHNL
jgi:hypothetical protein